jgi:GTP cyclohydrolase I
VFPVERVPSGGHHNEMVVVRDIPVYSTCEHHLLPFWGKAHIAYIPDPSIGIVGLSKVNRVVDVFARRLQTQERLNGKIREAVARI